jgi:hypothetical protein
MVPVSAFLSRLLPNVIGCPEPLAMQALVDSAITFCEQSLIAQTDLDPADVKAGVSQYELELPSQTRLGQVLRVWADNKLLVAAPSFQVTQREPLLGEPLYFFNRDIDEQVVLHVYPTPNKDATGGLVVRVATVPTRSATQLHSALFQEWNDAIVEGAMARLYDTPGQVFTNEAKALVLMQKVRAKTNVARVEALRGRAVSSLSVTMRGF